MENQNFRVSARVLPVLLQYQCWFLCKVLIALYQAERELLPLPSVLLICAAVCTSPLLRPHSPSPERTSKTKKREVVSWFFLGNFEAMCYVYSRDWHHVFEFLTSMTILFTGDAPKKLLGCLAKQKMFSNLIFLVMGHILLQTTLKGQK